MSVPIQINNVVKRFGKDTIINGLSLNIEPGEFFTLLGPSGCGKTTLLRMIIGFNSIEGGEIKVGGRLINDVPTNHRNMGMVFQNYAVFPHMSVKDNVGFGLKMRGIKKAEIEKRVDEILQTVKIEALKERMPTKLSGGQQQRVALARAIVIHPEVLLMDEPLSNLDAKLRVEMRNAIKRIQKQVGITTVYVTHDQEEALAVSDKIAVMNGGLILQIDTPQTIYRRPATQFVATFIGLSNILDGSLECHANGTGSLKFGSGYEITLNNLKPLAREHNQVKISVRPEEFSISRLEETGSGIPATVISSVFLGTSTHYFLELQNGQEIEVIDTSDAHYPIANGKAVWLQVNAKKLNVFSKDGNTALIDPASDGVSETTEG